MIKIKTILLFGLILSILSCEKDELKKPTKDKFEFNTDQSLSTEIEINTIKFTLSELNILGKRVEGNPIDFKRELSTALQLNLTGISQEELDFDIPQGEYTELLITFKNELNSTTPSILINGSYKLTQGPNVDVVVELNLEHIFSILTNLNGQNSVTLKKSNQKTIMITLNYGYWLSSISSSDLDNADLIIGNSGQGLGNSTILINSTNNINLFNKFVANLNGNNSAKIE